MTVSSPLPFTDWESTLADGEFEEAYAAVDAIVQALESGDLRLADSIRCFELGNQLSRKCEQILSDAELRITRLDEIETVDPNAPISLFPRP